MRIQKWKKVLTVGLVLLIQSQMSLATDEDSEKEKEEISTLVPVIYPGSKCVYEDLKVPDALQEKGYRFLSNRDCSAYFVLPPEISEKRITVTPHGSLSQCKAYKIAEGNQTIYEQRKQVLLSQSSQLELQYFDAKDPAEEKRIQEKIDRIDQKISKIDELKEKNMNDMFSTYGQIKGLTYSILLANQIDQRDLDELSRLNVKTVENPGYPDNNLPKYVQIPKKIMRADIRDSLYSFNFVSPQNRGKMDTILSTSFPGKFHLEQVDANNRVAHVKLGNVGSASLTLSLVGSCTGVEEKEDGRFILNKEKEPFIVNRSYYVDRQFTNGYYASVNINSIKEQIASETVFHKNKGFTKDQVFSDVMTNDLDSVMTFEWTEEYEDQDDEISFEEVLKIKQSVFAFSVDNFFEKLESEGKLRKVEASDVTPAQGGNVTTNHMGHRCWTEKILVFRRTRCGNYTYQVTQWKDGVTEKEITDTLEVDFNSSESMRINQSVPFFYSSTFEL